MNRRVGASLLNVMIFMMFAVMITSQVFFFAKWSADSVAEQREIMMYRLRLDSLVEEAKDALKATESKEISHDTNLDENALKFTEFYDGPDSGAYRNRGTQVRYHDDTKWEMPQAWTDEYGSTYNLTIHDLDYSFDASGWDRDDWIDKKYNGASSDKKVFAAMPPLGVILKDSADNIVLNTIGKPIYTTVRNRFYLIRAYAELPENYYGAKLMYQVLVSRDEKSSPHKVDTLSFQEVWF